LIEAVLCILQMCVSNYTECYEHKCLGKCACVC